MELSNRRPYPYDLTDEQWELVSGLLPSEKPAGTPGRGRVHSNRELLNAILYQLRVGGAWRALPHDLPHWLSVYAYFRRWSADGTLERVHDALRRQVRLQAGKAAEPSVAILDSQSVKSTERGGERLGEKRGRTAGRASRASRASATTPTSA